MSEAKVTERKPRKPRAPKAADAPPKAAKPKPSPEEVRRKELLKNVRKNKARIMSAFSNIKEATNEQLLNMATFNLTGSGVPSIAPEGVSEEGSPSE